MSELSGRKNLELGVKDFGPILEAKIDLRPLTVFVGPSNTGKSYLATLIYALHRALSGAYFPDGYPRRTIIGRLVMQTDLAQRISNNLMDLSRQLVANGNGKSPHGIVLPLQVTEVLRQSFNQQANALPREIGRCFGIGDASKLIRRGRTESRFTVTRRVRDHSRSIGYSFSLSKKRHACSTMLPDEVIIPIRLGDEDAVESQLYRLARDFPKWGAIPSSRESVWASMKLLSLLSDVTQSSIVDPLHQGAFYLPADRTGMMHAYSVVVRSILGSSPDARAPMLSGVLADFLQQLFNIDQNNDSESEIQQRLGDSIEKRILAGSIRIKKSPLLNFPDFTYRPQGWKKDLALVNASSMVSDLAPLVLYVRHLIRPGHVLIIEEPESHLHPEMQVELTRQIAMLVNAGVRVIVTTHSEWLLEALANIVRQSQIHKSESDEHESEGVALDADQVGVWLFEATGRSKDSVIREIPLDESGLYPSGFDEVARALHNDWARITNRIGEAE